MVQQSKTDFLTGQWRSPIEDCVRLSPNGGASSSARPTRSPSAAFLPLLRLRRVQARVGLSTGRVMHDPFEFYVETRKHSCGFPRRCRVLSWLLLLSSPLLLSNPSLSTFAPFFLLFTSQIFQPLVQPIPLAPIPKIPPSFLSQKKHANGSISMDHRFRPDHHLLARQIIPIFGTTHAPDPGSSRAADTTTTAAANRDGAVPASFLASLRRARLLLAYLFCAAVQKRQHAPPRRHPRRPTPPPARIRRRNLQSS
jgi:hypothetical protein